MITAVDTNVLLDLLVPNAPHSGESAQALVTALDSGSIIICEVIYAELAGRFLSAIDLDQFFANTGLRLEPTRSDALYLAGLRWRDYLSRGPAGLQCPACGNVQVPRCYNCDRTIQSRQHVIADFLIGAHAVTQADRLLTRDRGYYSTYFPELTLA